MCNITFKDGNMLSFCRKIDSLSSVLTLSGPGFEKLAQTGGGRIPPPS